MEEKIADVEACSATVLREEKGEGGCRARQVRLWRRHGAAPAAEGERGEIDAPAGR